MIDHLIKADDLNDFLAMMNGHLGFAASNMRPDISFACQVIETVDSGQVDDQGQPILTQTALPYYYQWIALPAEDAVLIGLAGCVIVSDRDAANRGEPFVLYATMAATLLDVYSVSPVIAGSQYPFGAAA